MYPNGIIYKKGESPKKGVIFLRAPLRVRMAFGVLRGAGAGLVGFAVMALVFTFGPVVKEEYDFRFKKTEIAQNQLLLDNLENAKADEENRVRQEASSLGLDSYFALYIPKIDAKSKIVANVDPNNSKEYQQALQEGVAHTKGTFFPGQGKLVYLFSHSTDSPLNFARYNAVFYMLRKLENGDRTIIYFADKKYEYEVVDKVITQGNDISWLTKDYSEETIVLQTCDPPGTTWNRLLVIAKPVK